jgi:hypothetical protein
MLKLGQVTDSLESSQVKSAIVYSKTAWKTHFVTQVFGEENIKVLVTIYRTRFNPTSEYCPSKSVRLSFCCALKISLIKS